MKLQQLIITALLTAIIQIAVFAQPKPPYAPTRASSVAFTSTSLRHQVWGRLASNNSSQPSSEQTRERNGSGTPKTVVILLAVSGAITICMLALVCYNKWNKL
jgi:hypothetical protein